MRIEQMISGAGGLMVGESESEPEPSGLTPYAQQLVAVSRTLQSIGARSHDWISDSGELRVAMRPKRIVASLGGKAFERYLALASDDRREETEYRREEVEDRAIGAMCAVDPSVHLDDVNVMINHVPLVFAKRGMIEGRREWQGTTISFTSDKLQLEHERHMLIGGLATIFYYIDYPKKPTTTKTVE